MKTFAALGLGLALAATLAPAASAVDLVVVEARGVALRAGQQIDGSKPLTLKEGQQVVLISPTGKTIKLRGPSEAAPAGDSEAGTADVAGALRTLVTAQAARTDRMGVVRAGAAAQQVPPEPWLLDVTRVGNRCVPAGTNITFWRPGGGPAGALVIAPSDRSWRARADWPAGADRLVMPQAVPLTQRSSYLVSVAGKESAITLISMPATLSNDLMRIAWMIEAGCDGQAQSLLAVAGKATETRAR